MPLPSRRLVCSALLAVALAAPLAPARAATTLVVFAAASLKNAMDEAAAAYQAKSGVSVKASYAGSSALAKQIEQGAPADLFASADTQWMDYLGKKSLVQAGTRKDLLGNTLVVVAGARSRLDSLELTPAAFDKAVGNSRWTTGTVSSVPCGIYAKQAMTKLGLWATAEPKLAQAPDVRSAMAFVSRGEAPLSVVYQTDANADKKVKVVARFPDDSHDPIVYPFALTKNAKPEAAAFLAFLTGPEGRPFFEKQGFRILP